MSSRAIIWNPKPKRVDKIERRNVVNDTFHNSIINSKNSSELSNTIERLNSSSNNLKATQFYRREMNGSHKVIVTESKESIFPVIEKQAILHSHFNFKVKMKPKENENFTYSSRKLNCKDFVTFDDVWNKEGVIRYRQFKDNYAENYKFPKIFNKEFVSHKFH